MENSLESNQKRRGITVLVIVLVASLVLTILFNAVIASVHLSFWPLYFLRLGLYLLFFLPALWGLRTEKISLPVSWRKLLEAVGYPLVGWGLAALVQFVLVLFYAGVPLLPRLSLFLAKTPPLQIGAQALGMWFFVALGEELLFRGYFLEGFRRYFTRGGERWRMVAAVLITSAIFAIWYFSVSLFSIPSNMMGQGIITSLLLSMLIRFGQGIGLAILFIRSRNILLAGLTHGVMDFPLIGLGLPMTFIILLGAIGCAEIARLAGSRKAAISAGAPG